MIPLASHVPLLEHRRSGGLVGFLAKGEVDALFKQQPLKTLAHADPLDLWRRFDTQRGGLAPVPTATVSALPTELQPIESEVRARSTFKQYYESVADHHFGVVAIDSLLSPQWLIDLDYVEELKSQLGASPTAEQQLRFAFPSGSINQPIVAGNQVLFSSSRRDLHADPIPEVRKTAADEYEIIIRAQSRPNYVNVVILDNRLLLVNGVHKVCALSKLGLSTCFCAYRTIDSLSEAGINTQTSLFRDTVFKGFRPALVNDFLREETSAPIYIRSMSQILQVSIGVGATTIPALPNA